MKITKVYITLPEKNTNENFLGYASITFDDSFCIDDVKVCFNSNTEDIYLIYPSNNNFNKNIAYPITKDFRKIRYIYSNR